MTRTLLMAGVLFSVNSAGSNYFDWGAIRACAAQKIPGPPASVAGGDMMSAEYQEFTHAFTTIQNCRLMLTARHEGWLAGVGQSKGAVDPYPPEPMMRPDDMR